VLARLESGKEATTRTSGTDLSTSRWNRPHALAFLRGSTACASRKALAPVSIHYAPESRLRQKNNCFRAENSTADYSSRCGAKDGFLHQIKIFVAPTGTKRARHTFRSTHAPNPRASSTSFEIFPAPATLLFSKGGNGDRAQGRLDRDQEPI
jgi:hypothetical protein